MRLYREPRDPTTADHADSVAVHPSRTDFNLDFWVNTLTGDMFLLLDAETGDWRRFAVYGSDDTLTLPTPVYDDQKVSLLASTKLGLKDPQLKKFADDGAGSTGVYAYAFDATNVEELLLSDQATHRYKLNTTVHPHIHWSPDGNGSAGQLVRWGLEVLWLDNFATVVNTEIVYGSQHVGEDGGAPDDPLEDHKVYITPLGDGLAPSDDRGQAVSWLAFGRIFRDAGHGEDTYGNDAFGLSIDWHIEIDTLGSASEYSK